jgi:acetylornithine deacetylase
VVEHLSQLIQIPSVSTMSNRAITNYASGALTAQGWAVREATYTDERGVEKVNLITAPPGQDVRDRMVDLAFLCHTDTVPYSEDWREALQAALRGPMLHGCGACDVKGFLACLLAAAEHNDAPWIDGLRIVLTADEEVGCIGSKRLIAMDFRNLRSSASCFSGRRTQPATRGGTT